ncbi:PilZ domain-containing protein [Novosphingobium sp.]|uniref:PilZ domain-containing protein n=1 Tax=Novosphingobium sp. TaxID=1874826 RepID=UPI00286D3771|nr:PilZ domain-containing protein [Novosphingobium sp.]
MTIHNPPRPALGGRLFNRLRLGAAASLELIHPRRACLLDDISSTGARLRIDPAPANGAMVLLHFHELKVYARVIWSKSNEVGLQFEQPLALEDMQGMLWITNNRDLYERICRDGHAQDWADGFGA